MTNIEFTYEVIAVDNTSKTMTIRYSASNYPDVEVIAPFPVLPDTVETMANASAPFHKWRSLTNQYDLPTVGKKGSGSEVTAVSITLSPL